MHILSSDDEDIDYGRQKALPVADFDYYDPNVPPSTGEEYLRRVQLEAAKCPKVVVAPTPRVIKTDVDHKEINDHLHRRSDTSSHEATLSFEEQQELVADFSQTRTRLERMRDMLTDDEKKKARSHHPSLSNVFYYKKWCLGNDISEDSSDEELVDSRQVRRASKGKGQKQPPVQLRTFPVKFLLSLDQQEVLSLLDMQIKWINDYGLDPNTNGQWVHSLLCALQKPLCSDAYSVLREVCRCLKRYRSQHDQSDDDEEDSARQRSIDLIICIIGRYFDQKDLL